MPRKRTKITLAIENGINLSYEEILKKIKPGELITYKEVCDRLNIPYYSSGNQKKAQLKELERYIEFESVNRKWLILDIYTSPLDKEVRAVPKNSIYVKYVECVLLSHLSKQPGNEIYIIKNKLWLLLGMINNNYNIYKDNYENLEENNELMTFFEVNNFYQRSNSYLSKIVDSSLNSLKRRYLIEWNKPYMISVYLEDGNYEYHEASVNETEKILELKRNTLLEFGFEDERQLIFSNIKKKKEYYDTLEQRFKDIYGWDKVYQAYHIIYNRKNVITALPHDQIMLQKLAINEKVIDKINLQAENIAEEKGINSDNVVEMLLDGEEVGFTYPLVYVEVQKMLAEKLLRIDNSNLVN
jgi:hypothetical protein